MTEQEAIKEIKGWSEILMSAGKKCTTLTAVAQDMAIQALEEIQKYRTIGTVEECRTAMERQIPKKPNRIVDGHGIRYTDSYRCQNCGKGFSGTGIAEFCYHCGQKLDWSDAR